MVGWWLFCMVVGRGLLLVLLVWWWCVLMCVVLLVWIFGLLLVLGLKFVVMR